MRRVCLPFVSCLISLALSGCPKNVINSLTVTRHPQEAYNWCWAASAQMVMEYLGHGQKQCLQVNDRLERTDCSCRMCSPGSVQDPACDVADWPDFNKYDFDSQETTDAPLSWDELRVQLSREKNGKKTPFIVTWKYVGKGGHMLVATGYRIIDGEKYVDLLDPGPACLGKDFTMVPYEFYREGDYYTHWNDYYNIRFKGN